MSSTPDSSIDSRRSPPSTRRAPSQARDRSMLAARAAASVLAIAVLLLAEIVAVAVLHRSELLDAWELRVALSRLLPIGFLIAAPLGLVGLGLLLLVEQSHRRPARIALAALAGCGGAAIGYGVSGGRHFRELALRAAFVAAVALMGAAIAWVASKPLSSLRRRSSGGFLLLTLIVVVVLHAANMLVLPRLYPAFHIGLSTLGLLLGAWLGEALVGLRADRVLVGVVGSALFVSGAFAQPAARNLRSWDNVRMVYLNHAPWAAQAVLAASRLAPSEVPADTEAPAPSGSPSAGAPAKRWIDWTGRDVLLVSIDALRADHVGAYGYARATTPEIDALAKQGVQFDHAYCAMPHTSYSITSLMTGKYMRPLLLQNVGEDSETLASWMRVYGYRTAAFYPPAVFAIDPERFAWVEARGLDFEYRKVEYAPAEKRFEQLTAYLAKAPANRRLMLWVHLFEPHEPYEAHPEHDFGDRDVDRYDSEVAVADAVVGKVVRAVREKRPNTVVILTADHGEEFGEHGGYYHGTTVHEEQVRVPLVVVADGLTPHRVSQPVQLIDVVPTILHALDVPRSPRLRGGDLGPWLAGQGAGEGMAFAESDEHTMLALDRHRLICQRKADACAMYDVLDDPGETRNISAPQVERFRAMRARLRELSSSHGRYELAGAREEGRALPGALRRGMTGDGDAAQEVASMLDDADVVIRRKAAEVLFNLRRDETSPSLRLALSRDEDDLVRRWCALALTRLGQGAPRAGELLQDHDPAWNRLAALAFAEAGDNRGEAILIAWWEAGGMPFERAREIIAALGRIKSSAAVVTLCKSLGDVRLRPYLAATLAQIGDPYGRISLVSHFPAERYETSRRAMAEALVALGATREMAPALVRFLGVPDPLPGGLDIASRAKILDSVGGPDPKALARLLKSDPEGMMMQVFVPKGGNKKGVRLLARGKSRVAGGAELRVGRLLAQAAMEHTGSPASHRLDSSCVVLLRFEPERWTEPNARLPDCMRAEQGKPLDLVVVPSRDLECSAIAVVPLADEIPPPAPEPWVPGPEQPDPD
ncbi:MAG: sulfatase-like hydrolase/transferase [Deltaproteobacteria bacterium]|nr:sulfatase-like hydrolase/transferase [Deltaproteobacteria bacterium]